MTSQTNTFNTRPKHSIARFFGVLFIFSALIASALTVIWPYGSSAASSSIAFTPDADTYVRQSTPAAPTLPAAKSPLSAAAIRASRSYALPWRASRVASASNPPSCAWSSPTT